MYKNHATYYNNIIIVVVLIIFVRLNSRILFITHNFRQKQLYVYGVYMFVCMIIYIYIYL